MTRPGGFTLLEVLVSLAILSTTLLLAYQVISGAIAGLSGFLFAVKDGFVNPELLSWHLSGAVLIMIILGGIGHLRGALIGAFAFAEGPWFMPSWQTIAVIGAGHMAGALIGGMIRSMQQAAGRHAPPIRERHVIGQRKGNDPQLLDGDDSVTHRVG